MEHGFKILSHVATPQHHYKNKNKKTAWTNLHKGLHLGIFLS